MNATGAHRHRRDMHRGRAHHRVPSGLRGLFSRFLPHNRPARIAALAGFVVVALALGVGLVFRGSFPVEMAEPWIRKAIEEKLGPGHQVEIGATDFESDASGAWRLRVRDLIVRGPDGDVLASAPRAEVALDGGILSGVRARSIDLVNAEMTVQIGADGRVAVFAGRDATAGTVPAGAIPARPSRAAASVPLPPRSPLAPSDPFRFSELIAWLDGLEQRGFDGISLTELGLKHGTLVIDNAVTGRRLTFRNIETRLERQSGGFTFRLASGEGHRRWSLTATVTTAGDGSRAIDFVADRLAPFDLLQAAGFDPSHFTFETPISGIFRAQIAADGRLLGGAMRLGAATGRFGKTSEPEGIFTVDEAQLHMRYDPERRALIMDPLAIASGANRTVLQGVIEAPRDGDRNWHMGIVQGRMVLTAGRTNEPPLVIDRVLVRGSYDPLAQKFILQQGELSGATAAVALSGSIGLGSEQPILSLGVAGTKMSSSALKRLWPSVIAPGVR
jgi:hypothetical protein